MNERIQELSNKATLTCMEVDPAHAVPAPNLRFNQIFAELIVAECCQVMESLPSSTYHVGRTRMSEEIKQHFGVEL